MFSLASFSLFTVGTRLGNFCGGFSLGRFVSVLFTSLDIYVYSTFLDQRFNCILELNAIVGVVVMPLMKELIL